MSSEVPFQKNMFTDEWVDARSPEQREYNATREFEPGNQRALLPTQVGEREDVTDQGQSVVEVIDSSQLLLDMTGIEAPLEETGDDEETELPPSVPSRSKQDVYLDLVCMTEEQAETLWIDPLCAGKYALEIEALTLEATRLGLSDAEIEAAIQIGIWQGTHKKQEYANSAFRVSEHVGEGLPHDQLLRFLENDLTQIHVVERSENLYGEFLFLLVSQPTAIASTRAYTSFWGLGYHKEQARWLVDEWAWYMSDPTEARLQLAKRDVYEVMERRLRDVLSLVHHDPPIHNSQVVPIQEHVPTQETAPTAPPSKANNEKPHLPAQSNGATKGNAIPMQYTLFTGELVDNRTAAQKRLDHERMEPRQGELFSQREIALFGVSAHPQMALSANTKLVLISEDLRTPEEIERDIQRQAEALTPVLL